MTSQSAQRTMMITSGLLTFGSAKLVVLCHQLVDGLLTLSDA